MSNIHKFVAPFLALACLHCTAAEEPNLPPAPPAAPADQPTLDVPPTVSTGWNLPPNYQQFGPTVSSSPFCGNHLPPPTMAFALLVPPTYQETGNWCVLASIQMVVGLYGITVDQCRLADWRAEFPEGTCCADKFNPLCDRGTYADETVKLLSGLGFYGAVSPGPIAESELRDEVSNGRPVIFIEGSSTGSHAIVAFGFEPASEQGFPDQFGIYDPVTGFATMSYANMRSRYWDGWAVWPATFYRISPSPDGCNRDFDPTCGCTGGGT